MYPVTACGCMPIGFCINGFHGTCGGVVHCEHVGVGLLSGTDSGDVETAFCPVKDHVAFFGGIPLEVETG